MSRVIEAAALFAVGVVTGGAVVYSTTKHSPRPPSPPAQQQPPPPALLKDVITGEVVSEGTPIKSSLLIIELRRLLRYGHPGPVFDIGNRTAFVSSYDRRMRNPSWVSFELGRC
jgi:endonuclease G, mitochondrial